MLKSYLAFDVETTGLSPETDEIIEIGALKVREGKVCERFISFVKPSEPVSERITEITGITNEMLKDAAPKEDVIRAFLDFCGDEVLIGHNLPFDYSFVKNQAKLFGLPFEKQGIDTLKIARCVHKGRQSNSLEALCAKYSIVNSSAHRAYHDALATAKLYQTLAHYFEAEDPKLFKPVQLTYKVKRPQPATPKQIAFLESLIRKKGAAVQWDPETISRSEASRLIDGLLKG